MAHENDDHADRLAKHQAAGLNTDGYLPKGVNQVMHPSPNPENKPIQGYSKIMRTVKTYNRPQKGIDSAVPTKSNPRDLKRNPTT